MLDKRLIREEPDKVKSGIEAKGLDVDIDHILALDKQYVANLKEGDELKHERNERSKEIGRKKRAGESAEELHERMKEIAARIKEIDERNKEIDEQLDELLLLVPNLPHENVPVGKDPEDNVVHRTWGEVEEPYFETKPHWEIGEEIGVLDLEMGRRVSGRGFIVFKGDGALLCRALVNMMIDIHLDQGYEEVSVPYVVHRDSMIGTGQLPKMEYDMYRTDPDDLFLIPTAEVPVTNLLRDTFIDPDLLPVRYTAYSPCFRREAGSHGADTRGLLRVHQFDKVEMVKFVHPDTSYDELETLVEDACVVLEALELPYRVVELCTGDLSFSAAKCYDLEVFAPGVGKWLEVSSCSNFESFQARRAGIKIKKKKGDRSRRSQFVHTLNGSGLALPRIVAAILEVNQTPTGRVKIPEKLQPYMNNKDYLG
jgi:seryl-tRNA synthetase